MNLGKKAPVENSEAEKRLRAYTETGSEREKGPSVFRGRRLVPLLGQGKGRKRKNCYNKTFGK